MRKLATIQKVIDLQPIPGADQIEVATVLGWHVVVRKGEFKIGDQCVYLEVDSLLPQTPDFEFLAKAGTKKSYVDGKEFTGYRLKTVRLRGQISQGLCLPVSVLSGKKYPTDTRENPVYENKEGDEVTDLLGVVKYEPMIPASLAGIARGLFPSFIPKTDEMRIQSAPAVLERHKNKEFYITEKLDGSSVTVFKKDGELHVCSRNLDLMESDGNTLWRVVRELKLEDKLLEGMAVQGEIMGHGIQNNSLKIPGHKLFIYSVYSIGESRYFGMREFLDQCFELELETVPVIHGGHFEPPCTVDELVSLATRKSVLNPESWAEGIVIRSMEEARDEDLGRLSFKIINPEYLLENE